MDVLRETKNSPSVAARSVPPTAPAPKAAPVAKIVAGVKAIGSGSSSGGERKGSGRSPASSVSAGKVKSWFEFLTEVCGLSEEDAKTYASTFKKNDIQEDQISDINTQILKDLGVKVGHLMRIMKGVRSVKQP
jgi:hypothetical protein